MGWLSPRTRECGRGSTVSEYSEGALAICIPELVKADADWFEIHVPALVIHRRGDAIVSFEAGRELASLIPGARLLPLEGKNRAMLANETQVV
jgi:pimeloyl-ACP methyl ester carboxylesterase